MMQQQQRTRIRSMKYIENSIVFRKVQSTSNNMAAAVIVFLIKKDGSRRWHVQQSRQNKERQKQQQQQLIIQKQKQSSVRQQRTRHRKTLTESTLLCSTRMVDFDFDNIFDGSFSSTNSNNDGGGAFAEFIFDGDSEDELYDEHETSYWEGCQGS